MRLNETGLLVQLSISQWTARKLDKRATKQVIDDNRAVAKSGRFNKVLFPINTSLDLVHQRTTAIRTFYYKETLPWGMEGVNLLPAANYLNFMTEFRKLKADGNRTISQFLYEYPRLRRDVQQALGDLYDPADYPEPEQVAKKFNIGLNVMPVPTNDWRVQLADTEVEALKNSLEQQLRESNAVAMRAVWNKLFERVQKAVDKLSDPSAIFRDALIENIQETCELLPRFNVVDDPNLEAMRQEVEQKLASLNPDVLRLDLDLRRDKAAEAKEIMDRMSVFMNGI